MSARPETIIRQKFLQRDATTILSERFSSDQVGMVGSMAVVRAAGQVLCLDLRASQHPQSRRRLAQHGQLRKKGFKVATVHTVCELQLALASLKVLE